MQVIHEAEARKRASIAKEKAVNDARILAKKFELRRQQQESEGSICSGLSEMDGSHVERWLTESVHGSRPNSHLNRQTSRTDAPIRTRPIPQMTECTTRPMEPAANEVRHQHGPYVSFRTLDADLNPPNQPSVNVARPPDIPPNPTSVPQRGFNPFAWPRPDQNAQSECRQPQQERTHEYAQNQLSQRQIATRHVLPKDLPSFTGRPEEWAMFISNYEQSTQICGYSDHENMIRLQRALKGKALKAVETRLLIPSHVPMVINTLRMLFGDPELIVDSILQSIRAYPTIKAEKMECLMDFALQVECLCATIETTGLIEELRNSTLLRELVAKLPMQIKLNWGMYVESSQPFPPPIYGATRPTLTVFSNWLSHVARSARRVTQSAPIPSSTTAEMRREPKTKVVYAHSVESNERSSSNGTKSKLSCFTCKNTAHKTELCVKFKELPLKEKWDLVNNNKLCRKCLKQHNAFRCPSRKLCGINGCTFKHHPLLHNLNRTTTADAIQECSPSTERPPAPCNIHRDNTNTTLFKIVPVVLYGNGKRIDTYAFLDDGSAVTLVEQNVADDLGIRGTPESLCLKWTADQIRTERDSKRISIQISSTNTNAKRYTIGDVRTVKELCLPRQSVTQSTIEQHPYLENVPIQVYSEATPRILIGIDHWKLGMPQLVREGSWTQPVATKTRLGWVLHGRCNKEIDEQVVDYSLHICRCSSADETLHQQVKDFFSIESFGVTVPTKMIESAEDERARRLLEITTSRDERGFTTGLLWKYDDVHLPDSLPMAMRRLRCLESKMRKDEELALNLRRQISEYTTKGYIRVLSKEEMQRNHPRIWYLPIFAVTNPNKPGKVRIVWDAAAKVNGISLNSVLLKGPDELASLSGVLQRFRQKPVAICGDIQEMYHQVRVNPSDQHSQRFLWRDGDETNEPLCFTMQVMTFGATCSPSSAQYIKNRNASEFRNDFPRTHQLSYTSIVDNHYVDDLLDSVDTEEEAVQLATDVIHVHRKGGFHIRNWLSNSKYVLEKLGVTTESRSKNLQMSKDDTPAKVLGMWWCTESDQFTFSLSFNKSSDDILSGAQRPTKREVLRTLMSIYDPLGFLASFLLPIKMLLQEVWRSGIGWDDQLLDDQFEKWLAWVTVLPLVESFRIPRFYFRSSVLADSAIQLHIFVDAGEYAYASVAYFRYQNAVGEFECSIVSAKTRVAPVQPLSIPRMELQAALLGTRLSVSIAKCHNFTIDKTVFWSDSRNVLSWLKSDARRFKQFVAFRISEILDSTNANQWRWISTKDNVADEATKWQKKYDFEMHSRWQTGPSFLKLAEDCWPTDTSEKNTTNVIELRPCFVHSWITLTVGFDSTRFSNWKRLLRAQAYVNRFIHNVKAKMRNLDTIQTVYFSHEEYTMAEKMLLRQAQLEGFGDEVAVLQSNKNRSKEDQHCIPKNSEIYSFSPYLDEDNMLRMRGRIDAIENVSLDTKRPILLPRKNHITFLLVNDFHRRFHHQSHESVVNEIRQKFAISSIRQTLRDIRNRCQKCKNSRAIPREPEMAPLPPARLAAHSRPFTFTGVDLFGPMLITVGRHTEKRWGVLYTCLTVRAVHIEVAHSLSTDSFIMSLKKFMARRGTPNEIYSDNGTNFVGANNELKTEIAKIKFDDVADATGTNIKWHFNPPASPHMGGAWERLVRSTKNALYAIMPSRNPNEETLSSLLTEVENIINSRPLTHIPIDSSDAEAITPNHFLLGSSSGLKPLGMFDDNVLILRKNWRKSERLAELFWRRWITEYLPEITRRTKWFHKTEPIKKGDVVIVVDQNTQKNSWPKGIVLDVASGKDGQVRHATIQTSTGIFKRPAVKLAVLDLEDGR